MRVKKYLAHNEKEALEQIKYDLGNNAIILNSKKVKKGGIFGLFGKNMLEVTVASEPAHNHFSESNNLQGNSSGLNLTPQTKRQKNSEDYSIAKEHQFHQLRDIIEKKQREYNQESNNTNIEAVPQQVNNNINTETANQGAEQESNQEFSQEPKQETGQESLNDLKQELNQTKNMMKTMMEEVRQNSFRDKLPKIVADYYDDLLDQDVKDEVARGLISGFIEEMNPEYLDDDNFFKENFKQYLLKNLKFTVDSTSTNKKPKVITMIGPTGVGKTTTVAKLAARYTLMEQAQVGLITIDTYRIAAVEQLKTYGDILSLPVEVVMTPQELKQAIDKLSDKDIIIIDTAGRSHKNQMQMTELKSFIDTLQPDMTHLVLSMGTKYKDLQKIISCYDHIYYNSLIMTKTDETDSLGNLINLLWDYRIGCSYLTIGQNVPDDLEEFSLNKFLDRMMGDRYA